MMNELIDVFSFLMIMVAILSLIAVLLASIIIFWKFSKKQKEVYIVERISAIAINWTTVCAVCRKRETAEKVVKDLEKTKSSEHPVTFCIRVEKLL